MKYNIIKTENYLIIVDDLEIKEGEYYLSKISNDVFRRSNGGHWIENYDKKMYQKIIAHLPLNGSPILEGVDLLPPLNDDDYLDGCEVEFINGYNKAKEKYKWTDEDVIKIVEKSRETGLTAEYLLLSLSQPKYPIAFEVQMKCGRCYMPLSKSNENDCWSASECSGQSQSYPNQFDSIVKTDGQKFLVGKWIY